jgi:hypothetical protein
MITEKPMVYAAKYAGKWTAAIGRKVIASGDTFAEVKRKVKDKDPYRVRYALIPTGYMAGYVV